MHSIRFQFFSFIAALLIVMLVLLNTYPIISSRDLVFEEKKSALSNQGGVIASSLSNLDRLTPENITEVLRLLDISGYKRIVVTDSKAAVVYDDSSGRDELPGLPDIAECLAGNSVFRSSYTGTAFDSTYAVPIYSRGSVSGAVYICEYDMERAEIISTLQNKLRVVSVLIGAISALMVAVFSRILLSRISALVSSIRIVASGNYAHRLTVRGRDEIAELGNEFNILTEYLEDTENQRRRFVADASHELKTPIAAIRLLSDSITQSGGMDSETMVDFVSDIGTEAERLQRITEELLDLSRLDDGVQIVPEPVDVKQVTVDALSILKPLANEKGVKIRCELHDGCVVMANTNDMYHIVFNLMENAVKYNVPEGLVKVSLREDESNVYLTVADTGIGIPEEDRLNIFGRFYRVDKARSRASGGTGLGLSIVHDAVLAHGGTIAVGQNKPQGSVFIVTFPRPTEDETGI